MFDIFRRKILESDKLYIREMQDDITIQDVFPNEWKSVYSAPVRNFHGQADTITVNEKNEWYENGQHVWNIIDFKLKENRITFLKQDPKNYNRLAYNDLKIVDENHFTGLENGFINIDYKKKNP